MIQKELSATLGASQDQTLLVLNDQGGSVMGVSDNVLEAYCIQGGGATSLSKIGINKEVSFTLNTMDQHGVVETFRKIRRAKTADDFETWESSEMANTVNAFDIGDVRTTSLILENHPNDSRVKINESGIVQTLSGRMGTGGGNVPLVMDVTTYQKTTGALCTDIGKVSGNQLATNDMFVANASVVRRLTPMECERLQGFPDNWTDIGAWTDTKGKLHKESSDAARFKALGNSIALPFWFWLLRRISAQYERPATMASLFDGIGGFPLCWERCNGPGTAIWASEIEEFQIAVTKRHFPEVTE